MSSEASPPAIRLSVVVPARNAEPWLGEALDSVLRQSVDAMEVIVLDNGSTDGTGDLVREVAARDGRVLLVQSAATSAAEARNEGVDRATGEYLVFADSDDIVPDGAYGALVDALDRSGSDMAIGDHLKFSANATWSPTKRWYDFEDERTSVAPSEVPGLLAGRACWNRVFRRSFWDRADLRFPSVASLEDMEPMTRAFAAARTVDVVPRVVYLYRDRGDGSSVSKASDAAATVRYLEHERACAVFVQHDEVLRAQHAMVVLDADGWVHLARFLRRSSRAEEVDAVEGALRPLLDAIPLDELGQVAPARRMLWALLLSGEVRAAAAFVSGTEDSEPADRAVAWAEAVEVLRGIADPLGLMGPLISDGLLPALVNGAETLEPARLVDLVEVLRDLPSVETPDGLLAAMQSAVRSGDVVAIASTSRLRRLVPLVVASARAVPTGLEVTGRLGAEPVGPLALVLQSDTGAAERHVGIAVDGRAWSAAIAGDDLEPGRWQVFVRAEPSVGLFPVVTARMPLPPLDERFPVQPLADRQHGWRFLVDRRSAERRGLTALATRLRNRLGRASSR